MTGYHHHGGSHPFYIYEVLPRLLSGECYLIAADTSEQTEEEPVRRAFQRIVSSAGRLRAIAATPPRAIFLFFSCLYVLTYQGRTNSYDGTMMFATTRALVEHGTLAVSSVSATGIIGRGGLAYSKYGIGQSLIELPLYLAGKLLGLFAEAKAAQVAESVAMLTNPLIMAACCTVFYGIVRRLGYRRVTAIRATLILGIATLLWPYSKTDFSELLLTFTLAFAALCVLQATRLLAGERTVSARARRDLLWLDLLAGSALGVALLTKYAALIYLPVFLLYATLTLPNVPLRHWRDLRNLWHVRAFAQVSWWLWLRRMVALLAPVAIAGVIVLMVNVLRFGSPTATGYTEGDRPFSGSMLTGLWGLLISPEKGLLFYDPLLFAGLLVFPLLLWRRPREALFPLGLFGGSLFFYAAYHAWSGGSDWGPRYLVPGLPYLLMPLLLLGCFGSAEIANAETLIAPKRWLRFLLRGATGVLVGVSALMQLLGVSVNYLMQDTYWRLSLHQFGNLNASLRASPIAMSLWTLRLSLQYAFLHTFAAGYASTDYPFGPPYPLAANMPQSGGVFPLQFFWFTLLPKPILAFAVGAVLLGAGMLFAALMLRRQMREIPYGMLENTASSAGGASAENGEQAAPYATQEAQNILQP